MRLVKAAIRRALSAITGQADTRAAIDKLGSRIGGAAAASRETSRRLKTTMQVASDRILQLQRHRDDDRQAILDELARLREEQQALRAQLTAVSRLTQRTYAALVDNEPFDEDALDFPALGAHVEHSIMAAPMRTEPFPHLVIADLLPGDLYTELLRAIPAPTFWRHAGYRREKWHIDEDRASRLSETTWRFMHREIARRLMTPLLLNRFSGSIAAYWRETFDLDPAMLKGHYICDEGRLMLRRPGYELQPHLDPPNAILTVLFYLAQPGAPDTYGTDLYASGPLPVMRTGILHTKDEGIHVKHVTTVPFRANTALAFITPFGVHGAAVPPTVDERFERISYQFLVALDDTARRLVRRHMREQAADIATAQ
jgi:hypothetical protein